MKKISAIALLLVSLSMPAFAGPRDDDSPGRLNPVQRVVHFVKHLLASVLDEPSFPKP
jgi:hypothetical protein